MKIILEGLDAQQRQIADLLWSCDDERAMQQMIDAMPAEYRQMAVSVRELMIAAVFDTHMEVDPRVKDLCCGL